MTQVSNLLWKDLSLEPLLSSAAASLPEFNRNWAMTSFAAQQIDWKKTATITMEKVQNGKRNSRFQGGSSRELENNEGLETTFEQGQ